MAKKNKPVFRAVFRSDQYGWSKYKNDDFGFGSVGAIHKGRKENVPHRFANELISGRIAQFLQLPIPAFGFTQFKKTKGVQLEDQIMFSQLDFNFERESTALPEFDFCYSFDKTLCAGILLFDILVANSDRRKANFWCDNAASPKQLMIFDHDHTLLGCDFEGLDRLRGFKDELGLRFLDNETDHHPFLNRVDDISLFDEWFDKIYSIPCWLIRTICEEARSHDLNKNESKAIVGFLDHRRKNLEGIIGKHLEKFPLLKPRGGLLK